ncbi:putative ATP-citrate synthase, partial [Frankliniella fusca]
FVPGCLSKHNVLLLEGHQPPAGAASGRAGARGQGGCRRANPAPPLYAASAQHTLTVTQLTGLRGGRGSLMFASLVCGLRKPRYRTYPYFRSSRVCS